MDAVNREILESRLLNLRVSCIVNNADKWGAYDELENMLMNGNKGFSKFSDDEIKNEWKESEESYWSLMSMESLVFPPIAQDPVQNWHDVPEEFNLNKSDVSI